MRPGEGKELRAICLNLSLTLHSGVDFFLSLPVDELVQMAREAANILNGKSKQGVPARR